MKKLIILYFLFITTGVAAQTNPQLSKLIDSLYEVDQAVQWKILSLNEQGAPQDSIQKQQGVSKDTYIRHLEIIKGIYAQYGYPTTKMVGEEVSHEFFVLIQHADSDPQFQATMLPVIGRLSRKGKVAKKDYAYLYDRVQRNTGGKQRYGTQPSWKKGNLFDENNRIIYPTDLEDPQNVDKRRKKMGLEPLEQYYETVLQTLGRPRKKP
ncbi:MAG: hypothetical protein QM731_21750 [Chitinophagaceae bacterium]